MLDLIGRVADERHMDSLALVDTFGAASPYAMQYFVRQVKKCRPGKPLEAHVHMDFGMGAAKTIMALADGVEVVQSTVHKRLMTEAEFKKLAKSVLASAKKGGQSIALDGHRKVLLLSSRTRASVVRVLLGKPEPD